MKASLLGLCSLLIVAVESSCAPRQSSTPAVTSHASTEQELLTLSRDKWRWMSEKKADTLAALFHDQAVFVHMGGSWGRTQELDVIRSGGIHYKHAEIQAASVRFAGPSTAIVLNTISLLAVVGGNEVTNPFEVTEVYVRQDGAWKLASLSFTRLLR